MAHSASPWAVQLVCIIGLLAHASCYGPPPVFGLYTLVVKSLHPCQRVESAKFLFAANLTKSKESILCSGTVEMKEDLDDSVLVALTVEVWVDDRWELFQQTNLTNVCSCFAQGFSQLFAILFASSSCPVPEGVYHMKDVDLAALSHSNVSGLPYGRYQTTWTLYRDSTSLEHGCLSATFEIVPAVT